MGSNIIADAIQTRILDNLWSKCETQHKLIRTALKEKYFESEYTKTDFIDIAEFIYVSQRSTLSRYAHKLKSRTTESKSELCQDHAPKTSCHI